MNRCPKVPWRCDRHQRSPSAAGWSVERRVSIHAHTHNEKIGRLCEVSRRTYRQLRDVVRDQEVPVCAGPVHDETNDLFRCEDAKAIDR